MKKDFKRARSVLCIVLIACYVIGMLCMFIDALPIGLSLWTISLVGSLAVLYKIKIDENKAAEDECLRKAAEGSDDEDGEDQPCE